MGAIDNLAHRLLLATGDCNDERAGASRSPNLPVLIRCNCGRPDPEFLNLGVAMLVLSRRIGEKIVIPNLDLVLTVLDVHKDHVRIGLAAPQDVRIFRREIWDRIQANGEERELTRPPKNGLASPKG